MIETAVRFLELNAQEKRNKTTDKRALYASTHPVYDIREVYYSLGTRQEGLAVFFLAKGRPIR